MSDTIHFHFTPEGLALPMIITAEYEPADPSCGQPGGWFLTEAELDLAKFQRVERPKLARMLWDRESYRLMFGDLSLRVLEENAADLAQARIEDREEVEA